MKVESMFLAILMYLPAGGDFLFPYEPDCSAYITFDPDKPQNQFKCLYDFYFIAGIGIERNGSGKQESSPQLKEKIKKPFIMRCCSLPLMWFWRTQQVVYENWDSSLDHTNKWVKCPNGYFLQGIYISDQSRGLISDIENGRCVKPRNHPNYYDDCYHHDFSECFQDYSNCKCKVNYYVVGLYKKGCDDLRCLAVLKCCKMAEKPEDLDELHKVKTRVMDTTLVDIANLAHSFGYYWCFGCKGLKVGEDYKRVGDAWLPNRTSGCESETFNHRLKMFYNDWGFSLKNLTYGQPVVDQLDPEIIDSGTLYNEDSTDVEKSIERTETSVRSVKHTTTSTWQESKELGVTISYESMFGLSASGSYTFKYETSTSTTDERGREQTNTIVVNTKKTIKPNTAVKWNILLSKARTTVVYTATIRIKFSVELRGSLFGSGVWRPKNPNANFYEFLRMIRVPPPVKYKFGNKTVPFYIALKRASEENTRPWLWDELKFSLPAVESYIDSLTNETQYEFQLTGKIEDVIGKHIEVHWTAIPFNNTPSIPLNVTPSKDLNNTQSNFLNNTPSILLNNTPSMPLKNTSSIITPSIPLNNTPSIPLNNTLSIPLNNTHSIPLNIAP